MKTKSLFSPGRGKPPKVALLCILSILCLSLSAQEEGFFAAPVEVADEFGMDITPTEANLAFPALADIDGDGDLDLFYSSRELNSATSCWEVTAFDYYENQGSDECPEFVKQQGSPFGLPGDIAVAQFVDIDADGDLDLYSSNHCYASTISYFENTGSATAPAFSNTPTLSYPINGVLFSMIVFGDLDNDGDYDGLINGIRPGVFLYLENTGTPEQPQYTVPVENPFGLEVPPPNGSEWSLLTDWDCDGDLDVLNSHLLLSTGHNDWLVYYHENAGTPETPGFLPPVFTGDTLVVATLGDLDGDGDLDLLSDEYFYKNITQPKGCVMEPIASFSYGIVLGTGTVEFFNESTVTATYCREAKWRWDFGDGATSEEENPQHTYSASGNYTVRLIVEDVAGSDSIEQVLDVVAGLRSEPVQGYFIVYPNPATDFICLEPKTEGALSSGGRIDVFDMLGQKVQALDIGPAASIRVNVKELPAGNYLLKIRLDKLSLAGHFIKLAAP